MPDIVEMFEKLGVFEKFPFLKPERFEMQRQDSLAIKRSRADLEMAEAKEKGESINLSPVTGLTICSSDNCARNAAGLKQAISDEISRVGWDLEINETKTICPGTCPSGPYLGLAGLDLFYHGVRKSEVSEMLYETLFRNRFYFKRVALDALKATDPRVIYYYKTEVMIPLDPETCMVTLAKYLYDFNALMSCGKCTPCRVGCFQVTEIMQAFCDGKATAADMAQLEPLLWLMDQAAFCEFAPKVAFPLLHTIKKFRSEYEAHMEHGGCSIDTCGQWGV